MNPLVRLFAPLSRTLAELFGTYVLTLFKAESARQLAEVAAQMEADADRHDKGGAGPAAAYLRAQAAGLTLSLDHLHDVDAGVRRLLDAGAPIVLPPLPANGRVDGDAHDPVPGNPALASPARRGPGRPRQDGDRIQRHEDQQEEQARSAQPRRRGSGSAAHRTDEGLGLRLRHDGIIALRVQDASGIVAAR